MGETEAASISRIRDGASYFERSLRNSVSVAFLRLRRGALLLLLIGAVSLIIET